MQSLVSVFLFFFLKTLIYIFIQQGHINWLIVVLLNVLLKKKQKKNSITVSTVERNVCCV